MDHSGLMVCHESFPQSAVGSSDIAVADTPLALGFTVELWGKLCSVKAAQLVL